MFSPIGFNVAVFVASCDQQCPRTPLQPQSGTRLLLPDSASSRPHITHHSMRASTQMASLSMYASFVAFAGFVRSIFREPWHTILSVNMIRRTTRTREGIRKATSCTPPRLRSLVIRVASSHEPPLCRAMRMHQAITNICFGHHTRLCQDRNGVLDSGGSSHGSQY